MPHENPSHVAIPLAGVAQGEQLLPHEATEVSERHCPLHAWKPGSQVKVHAAPAHVGEAFAGVEHDAHTFWQSRVPALQVTPHELPSQVATPLVMLGHGVHEVPHDAVLNSSRHVPEHA